MSVLIESLKATLALCISWSIALAPFALWPAPKAIAQTIQKNPSLNELLTNLITDIDGLLDRTLYPDVPRQGVQGKPTDSEIWNLQKRLDEFHTQIQATMPSKIAAIRNDQLETIPTLTFDFFYQAARKLESLKVVLGQSVDPAKWSEHYDIKLPLQGIYQLKFIATLAYTSPLRLPLADEKNVKSDFSALVVSLNEKPHLHLQLTPDFLADAEQQKLLGLPSTKNSLMFAIHFAARLLYDAQASTGILLPESPQLSELSPTWKSRFASFKNFKNSLEDKIHRKFIIQKKSTFLAALSEQVKEFQSHPESLTLDTDFWEKYLSIAKVDGNSVRGINLETIRKNENMSFALALKSLVDFWSIDNFPQDIHPLILMAKRLSLQWLILANGQLTDEISDNNLTILSNLLDQRAERFTRELLLANNLDKTISETSKITENLLRKQQQQEFSKNLRAAAKQIKNFANHDISIKYLIGSEKASLDGLGLSPLNKALIDKLESMDSYGEAYLTYKSFLLKILQAYVVPGSKNSSLKLKDLMSRGINSSWLPDFLAGLFPSPKEELRFNPEALRDVLPTSYANALAHNQAQRKKDMEDLLKIGKILRFHIYEDLPEEPQGNKRPTPKNLNVGEGWFQTALGSPLTRYQEELKKDLFMNAPILGGIVHSGNPDLRPAENTPLWQYLAAGHLKPEQEQSLIDRQILVARQNAIKNLNLLDQQTRKVEAADEDKVIGNASEDIRTIVTRTAQLTTVLGQFAGASAYSEEIRQELLLPGFWENEMTRFSEWSNKAVLLMVGIFVIQMVGSRAHTVGRISDQIGKTMGPVFGINFSRIQAIIWGLIGVSLSESAYKGWGSEAERTEILKKFFQCNASGPCVASQADINRQTELRDFARASVVFQLGAFALFIGGLRLFSKVFSENFVSLGKAQTNQLQKDLELLKVNPRSNSLSDDVLNAAFKDARELAKSQTDPRVGELASIEVEQAYNRIRRLIFKEAQTWATFDQRFQSQMQKLGIESRHVKSQDSLAQALYQIEQKYAAGQMTTQAYLELKNSIFTINQSMAPIWKSMENTPFLRGFYEEVFALSAKRSGGSLQTSFQHFDQRVSNEFAQKLEEFYGTQWARPGWLNGRITSIPSSSTGQFSTRLEKLIEKIQQDLINNPEQAARRLETLRKLLAQENPL